MAFNAQLDKMAAEIGQVTQSELGVQDLIDIIDFKNSSCLNNDPKTKLEDVLNGGNIKSEADEQLLLTLSFQEAVKLKGIAFKVNEMKLEDCSGPKDVKLYINQPNMDFDDAENLNEVQAFSLSEDDLKSGKVIDTEFVKFQKVNSLTVFIETNQGDDEQTVLSKLQLFGIPRQRTNMSELKKVG
mmetsp:Transcript_18658/g.26180  ORF Transcript_18658/g.26180 Transcript_18658/m.26180 type:complete len:185 (-) Transcript_18658:364-918(-)|eukprot:CAMPEP_0175100284 /NCGR_PEP_ID=MMETSP0086_2-20121207/7002_1 /TAXON_ID=136419 /ORGANISM="Unknown Unknown, Strain D1" /LENGTH=184 /DNA_ID=CAMNT_0016374379 /DNA_START=64 /DNA_END=618 /DNA_ORIENTATION=+